MFADILNIDEDIQWNLERNCIWKNQKVSIVQSRKKPNFSLFPFERKSQLFTQLSSARTRNRWFFIDFCLFRGSKGKFFVWHKTLLSFYWKLTWTSFDGSFYLLFDLHRVPKKTSNSFLLAESCELIEGSTAFLALNISVFLRVCFFWRRL